MGSYLLAIRLAVEGKMPSPSTHPLTHNSVGKSARFLPGCRRFESCWVSTHLGWLRYHDQFRLTRPQGWSSN